VTQSLSGVVRVERTVRAFLLVSVLLLSGCASPVDEPGVWSPLPSDGLAVKIEGSWKTHANDPLPRYELAVAQVGARAYVIGGLRATAVMSSTVEVFDMQNNTWSVAPEFPGVVHHHAAAATADGSVYSFGGWVGIGQSASDLSFRLAPGAPAWTPVARMPQARGAHAAALVDGKVWLVGGTGLNGQLLKPIDVYDPKTDSWSKGPDLPKARDHLSVVVLGDEVWVLGGREKTLTTTSPEVQVYGLQDKTWSAGAEMTMRRGGFGAAVHAGRIYVMGGEDSDQPRLKNQFEVYDPVAQNWTQYAHMQRGRTGLGAAVWAGRVFAIAGGDPDKTPTVDAPESFGP
jgi:N-acetylneuraminic acid mutarotase